MSLDLPQTQTDLQNLDTLPLPDLIEQPDYEVILAALIAQARGIEGWTAELESDPVLKLLEISAYRELLLRSRINHAARSNLLAFAKGADLDHLGAFYGCIRLEEESDKRYRLRIQLKVAAMAGGGTKEYYRQHALSASVDVVDAAILRPVPGKVEIAIWVAEAAEASATLACVEDYVTHEKRRILGVPLSVRLAQSLVFDIKARIYCEPEAPTNLVESLSQKIRRSVADFAQLGRDLSRSWVLSQLHVAGVSKVELDSSFQSIEVPADAYCLLRDVELIHAGVNW